MYSPGSIIYFSPFYFPDGGEQKNKYFIVLQTSGENALIASLPTSIDHIPRNIEKRHGCIDHPEINFNCYYFKAGRPITTEGWGFPIDTYVYGPQVKTYDKKSFTEIYAVEGVDFEMMGRLTKSEFSALSGCIRNSVSVARKIRRLLGADI
jgi:hypothetical protein